MFKKISALLLLTAFTNVYAFSPVEQMSGELNKTFDNLNYKLNVEWDQKDSAFFDGTVAEFEKDIATLQDNGLTKQELMKYTLEKIKDKEITNEITELSKVINESQMTDEEARAFTIAKLNSTYSHGASWSGSRMGAHTAILIGVIIVIIICTHHKTPTRDGRPHTRCDYPTTNEIYCNDSVDCCMPVVL